MASAISKQFNDSADRFKRAVNNLTGGSDSGSDKKSSDTGDPSDTE